MFGVEEFAAIVNPPEPAILAVGAVREDVVVKDGAMKAGRVMTMTLACDHRIIDGVLAGRVRADPSVEHGISLFLSIENTRKGAATNAVQIARLLAERHLRAR